MPDKTDEKQGKFIKGKSGNPLGRPRGIRNKATLLMENHSHLCTKEKLRDELPLRGHLKCPQCDKNWTGSISSGNGENIPTTIVKEDAMLELVPKLLMNNSINFWIPYNLRRRLSTYKWP